LPYFQISLLGLVTVSPTRPSVNARRRDVFSETSTLLLYRFHAKAATRFLDEIKPILQIVEYDESVRQEAERIFGLLSKHKRLSFREAIS
jgi:hypothetical protein